MSDVLIGFLEIILQEHQFESSVRVADTPVWPTESGHRQNPRYRHDCKSAYSQFRPIDFGKTKRSETKTQTLYNGGGAACLHACMLQDLRAGTHARRPLRALRPPSACREVSRPPSQLRMLPLLLAPWYLPLAKRVQVRDRGKGFRKWDQRFQALERAARSPFCGSPANWCCIRCRNGTDSVSVVSREQNYNSLLG